MNFTNIYTCVLDTISKTLKNVNMNAFLKFLIFLLYFNSSSGKDPHDDDLRGKNLICFNDSFSVEDWGIKFMEDKKVELFSLNKSFYEIYKYSREYRTDIKNIIIMKSDKIENIISRSRLKLGNKQCKIISGDPRILLQDRIKSLKLQKIEGNKI